MSLLPTWGALGALLTALLLLLGSVRRRLVVRRRPPLMSSLFSFSKFLRDHPDYYPTITSQTVNKLLPTCSSKTKVNPPRFESLTNLLLLLEYAFRQSYIFNLKCCWQEGKVLARHCFIMLLCIINNLTRNPNKDEWPAEQSTHQGMALSSPTLYFSMFILSNTLWTSAGIIYIGLCSASGPFDVFILGGMLCGVCGEKDSRAAPSEHLD